MNTKQICATEVLVVITKSSSTLHVIYLFILLLKSHKAKKFRMKNANEKSCVITIQILWFQIFPGGGILVLGVHLAHNDQSLMVIGFFNYG